jgi:hypothetical protein
MAIIVDLEQDLEQDLGLEQGLDFDKLKNYIAIANVL